MRIENLARARVGAQIELSADIVWEAVDRARQRVFFRLPAEFDDLLADGYDAFLMAAWVPAIHVGERMIHVAGPVDPVLCDNLAAVADYLHLWYWYDYARPRNAPLVPEIEAPRAAVGPAKKPRAGMMFSGGVDSTYSLIRNREIFPPDHPSAIRDLIFVHGFDMGARVDDVWDQELDTFDFVRQCLAELVAVHDARLVPAYTNLRVLAPTADAWLRDFMGPAMAAVAHAMAGGLSEVTFAASYYAATLVPYGSHPLTDTNCAGSAMAIRHHGNEALRIDKIAYLADHQEKVEGLRVCLFSVPGRLNCGECEKCLRTKLEFIGVGHGEMFLPDFELDASLVRQRLELDHGSVSLCGTMADGLDNVGRRDLARAVRRRFWRYVLTQWFKPLEVLKGLDQILLGGWLRRSRALRRRAAQRKAGLQGG